MPILIKIPINHETDMPEHRYVHKCYKMLYYLDSVGKQTGHLKSSKFFEPMAFNLVIFGINKKLQMKTIFKQFEQFLRDQFIQKWHEELEKAVTQNYIVNLKSIFSQKSIYCLKTCL